MNKQVQRIRAAYLACERLVQSDHNASNWLRRSFDAAKAGEAQHRRTGKAFCGAGYRISINDTAHYFAVRWFLDSERGGPGRGGQCLDFADACSLREDALYGYGARDAIVRPRQTDSLPPKAMAWHKLREEFADVLAIDYSEDIAS